MAYIPAWQKIRHAQESLHAEARSDSERLERLERTVELLLDAVASSQSENSAASWPPDAR